MKKLLHVALSAVLATALPTIALASEPDAAVRIELGDIDLTSADGMEAATRRVNLAATNFCRNGNEHISQKAHRTTRRCMTAIRDNALQLLSAKRAQQLALR